VVLEATLYFTTSYQGSGFPDVCSDSRPKASGYLRPLADYGSMKMQGFTNNKGLANYPYNVGTMYSAGTELASAGGIPPSSYLFTDTWHNCGKEEE
jgi:hypothetical protein